jgi:hypothetical protein
MTITTSSAPSTRRKLPPDCLPCRSCGQAVRFVSADQAEVLTVFGPATMSRTPDRWEVTVTFCAECGKRRVRAAVILAAHPRIERENGDVGLDRLDAALAALDVVGDRRGRLAAQLSGSDAAVRGLIDALAPLGAAAAWSAFRAQPDTCESGRWAYVSGELVGAIREAHRGLLARQFELIKAFPPPESAQLRGCAFCGLGTRTARESNARGVWGDELRVPLAVFEAGGAVLTGHLCPECRADLQAVGGSIGFPAVWRALMSARGYSAQAGRVISMTGVKPWAALASGTAPNSTRWAHVDVAKVDAMLSTSPDVYKRAAR